MNTVFRTTIKQSENHLKNIKFILKRHNLLNEWGQFGGKEYLQKHGSRVSSKFLQKRLGITK
jgi:hypothetical protein